MIFNVFMLCLVFNEFNTQEIERRNVFAGVLCNQEDQHGRGELLQPMLQADQRATVGAPIDGEHTDVAHGARDAVLQL
jgi:hypothetical protein